MANGIYRLSLSYLRYCLQASVVFIYVTTGLTQPLPCPHQIVTKTLQGSSVLIIESPGYSSNMLYPNKMSCKWLIRGPVGKVIYMESEKIYLEGPNNGMNCDRYDFLRIYNGPTMKDKVLGTYCGNGTNVVETVSSTNEAFVLFVADDHVNSRGFKLYLRAKMKKGDSSKDSGPNLKAIISGVCAGILCSILFVTFACCCLSTRRCPCRRNNRHHRTVSPSVNRIQVRTQHQPVERRHHRRNISTVSAISTSRFTNPMGRSVASIGDDIPIGAISPPPYISQHPPPLESSASSNTSSSPPPPYSEQDPHPNACQSDSIPSYSSR